MNQTNTIIFLGIEITVKEEPDGTFATFFSNSTGSFESLHSVKALRGIKTAEEALTKGKDFVSNHQWEDTGERIGIFELHVRHWWDGRWGYGVKTGGSGSNEGGFKNRGEAVSAGRIEAQKMDSELKARIEQ